MLVVEAGPAHDLRAAEQTLGLAEANGGGGDARRLGQLIDAVVGIHRGATLGVIYCGLILLVVSVAPRAVGGPLFAPDGFHSGPSSEHVGLAVGVACAVVDAVLSRRLRPDHLAAVVLTVASGVFAVALRGEFVAWSAMVGAPAGLGLLSVATHEIVRPTDHGERTGSISPSGAGCRLKGGVRCGHV